MASAVPLVNHAVLQRYVHQRIRVVGEVVSIESGRVQIRTCDGMEVTVQTPPGSMQYNRFVCINGTWTSHGVLEEETHTNWSDTLGTGPRSTDPTDLVLGDRLDLKTLSRVIELMHGSYSHLFVPDV